MKEIFITYMFPGFKGSTKNECLSVNGDKYGLQFKWLPFGEGRPDYVIATEHIYTNKSFYKQYKKYVSQGAIIIFITGECMTPDLNICDYAVSFDRHLQIDDRVGRKPTLYFFTQSLFNEYINMPVTEDLLRAKTKFCNFMYSHPFKTRDELFYKISEYKKVDSIGKHLNNTGVQSTRYAKGWQKLSIEMRLPYKFSIAAENASLNGYTTEKLISCLEAKTIPIYWGDASVCEEFNTKAFINCHDYDNWDDVLARIKEIDSNPELFKKIIAEPWQTREQREKQIKEVERYENWVAHIFLQDKSEAKRMLGGTFHDVYMNWFDRRYNQGRVIGNLIYEIKKVKRMIFKQ